MQRGRGEVELPRAVVRYDDAVEAQRLRLHRVLGMHDALDHEMARPQVAVACGLLPTHRTACLPGDEVGDLVTFASGPQSGPSC